MIIDILRLKIYKKETYTSDKNNMIINILVNVQYYVAISDLDKNIFK